MKTLGRYLSFLFRRYTRLTGVDNDACVKLVKLAFGRKSEWKRKIEDWQNPIVENDSLPEWLVEFFFRFFIYYFPGTDQQYSTSCTT